MASWPFSELFGLPACPGTIRRMPLLRHFRRGTSLVEGRFKVYLDPERFPWNWQLTFEQKNVYTNSVQRAIGRGSHRIYPGFRPRELSSCLEGTEQYGWFWEKPVPYDPKHKLVPIMPWLQTLKGLRLQKPNKISQNKHRENFDTERRFKGRGMIAYSMVTGISIREKQPEL